MKNTLLILAATASLGLVACQSNPNSYTISGTVEDSQNGDTILLQVSRGIYLDTTLVEEGKFTFEGVADSAQVISVVYPAKEKYQSAQIVLEPGKITTDLKKYNKETRENLTTVGGTANNISMQNLATILAGFNAQISAATANYSEANDEEKAVIMAKYKEIMAQRNVVEDSVMRANITNPVGINILKNKISSLNPTDFDAIIALVPVNYQNLPFIENAKKINEIKRKVAVGQKFTDIELTTMDGKPIKLSDYAGKGNYVLVDFWASWCGPCRSDMPGVIELYNKYKKKGFEIVGVSLDNNKEAWEKGTKDLGITWPQMSDLAGWKCKGAELYAVRGIPFTVLIGPDGTIVENGLRGEALTKKLEEIYK